MQEVIPMKSIEELSLIQELYSSTPPDKRKVFQSPTLWLISGDEVVQGWTNTQPMYFYPLSILDFVQHGREELSELRIIESDYKTVSEAIANLHPKKVHFEKVEQDQIDFAKSFGSKVSAICNVDDINQGNSSVLSKIDYLVVRVSPDSPNIEKLDYLLPSSRLLLGARVYISERGYGFSDLVMNLKNIGFDFVHISKRLIQNQSQENLSERAQSEIMKLLQYQSKNFRVILPRNMSSVFNEKFNIDSSYGNSRDCVSSRQRAVLNGSRFYPCYTQSILESGEFSSDTHEKINFKQVGKSCSDCACIYENDMLSETLKKLKKAVDPHFLLGYDKNGTK